MDDLKKILGQNPYEPPTRKTKRSTKPRFHVASKQARIDLEAELAAFLARYWEASEALRGGNLKAASSFPEGCYPPSLAIWADLGAFLGHLPLSLRRDECPGTRSKNVHSVYF